MRLMVPVEGNLDFSGVQGCKDTLFDASSCQFLEYPDIDSETVKLFIQMNRIAYTSIMFARKVDLWRAEYFAKKLEQYKHILAYPSCSSESVLNYDYFLLFGDRIQIEHGKHFMKLGPVGFSPKVRKRDKITLLIESFKAVQAKHPDTYLWAEVPSEPSAIAKVLQYAGFSFLEHASTASLLLEQSDVKTIGRPLQNGHYYSQKGYAQRIAVKQP
jgi:hypothetical protein